MQHPKHIAITDYTYPLPEDRIAAFPLPERDASKLLVYQNGGITESTYRQLANFIQEGTQMVFNDTRVIPARMLFQKPTGGVIEIFCLEPVDGHDYQEVLSRCNDARWKCLIGGASKWKPGVVLTSRLPAAEGEDAVVLEARLDGKAPDAYLIAFSWNKPQLHFAEVLQLFGNMPLPPYIKRDTTPEDRERYQTIFARQEGSVAAPTAGLHFTQHILQSLAAKQVQQVEVTLHVGAGTFKPVKAATMEDHTMHAEWMDVSLSTIKKLQQQPASQRIAVGTTALRTLESLYWMGVKLMRQPTLTQEELPVTQWEPYDADPCIQTAEDALDALIHWMEQQGKVRLLVPTQIIIAPGYTYRMVHALITNFHQPQSTLLLLVAAAIGSDWKNVYDYALAHEFRFLSYGDGSLLFIGND